jgi:F0F1-type ATP synthase membrane subunit b/b'
MSPLPLSVTVGVAVALCASLLGNALLTRSYLGARDDATVAETSRQQADSAAQQCNAGVTSLQADAAARLATAEAARKVAEDAARTAQGKANRLLAKAPSVPGNACASAQAQVDEWLASRRIK